MTWTVIARQNGEGHVLSYDTEMDAVLGALGMAVTGYRTWTARVDDRGVEYLEDVESVDDLPPGWALCLTCQRGWNDEKSTSVTPAPSARCPFEYEHEEGDDMTTENAQEQVFSRDAIEARLDWVSHKQLEVLIDGNLLVGLTIYEDGDAQVTVYKSTHPDAEVAWMGLVNVAERGEETDEDGT